MVIRRYKGILFGRPAISKALYDYFVVPHIDDQITRDTAKVSVLPGEIRRKMLKINTRGLLLLFKDLHIVEYIPKITWIVKLNIPQQMTIATRITPIDTLDLTRYELYEFKEVPVVDEEFLVDLSQNVGGIENVQRLYGIPVLVEIDNEEKRDKVFVSLIEAWTALEENPGLIKGIKILDEWNWAIIVTEINYIEYLYQRSSSLARFNVVLSRARKLVENEEEI